MNSNGTDLTPLTTNVAIYSSCHCGSPCPGTGNESPQWSPVGSKIVFHSSRKLDGSDAPNEHLTYNIWRVNADGTGLMPLTTATAAGADSALPQWSPDGAKVVFHSSRNLDGSDTPSANFTYNVWRVNVDGTALTPLTSLTARGEDSSGARWSPQGTQIVFNSVREIDETYVLFSPNNIWRMNADGSGLTQLTTTTAQGADSFSPSFSP